MDPEFPGQHTTTTTVTTSTTTHPGSIRFDPSYIRTRSGLLKAIQVVSNNDVIIKIISYDILYLIKFIYLFIFFFQSMNLLGFICITCSIYSSHGRGGWFNTVAMGGFWFTGILLALYLFHVVDKFQRIPWNKIVSITYFFFFLIRWRNNLYLSDSGR